MMMLVLLNNTNIFEKSDDENRLETNHFKKRFIKLNNLKFF